MIAKAIDKDRWYWLYEVQGILKVCRETLYIWKDEGLKVKKQRIVLVTQKVGPLRNSKIRVKGDDLSYFLRATGQEYRLEM